MPPILKYILYFNALLDFSLVTPLMKGLVLRPMFDPVHLPAQQIELIIDVVSIPNKVKLTPFCLLYLFVVGMVLCPSWRRAPYGWDLLRPGAVSDAWRVIVCHRERDRRDPDP